MGKDKNTVLFFIVVILCGIPNQIYSEEMPKIIYLKNGQTIETEGVWLPINLFDVNNTYILYHKGGEVKINVEVKDVDIEKTFGSKIYNEYLEKRHKRERSAELLKKFKEEQEKGDVYRTDYQFDDVDISNFKVEKKRADNRYREEYEYYISMDITYNSSEPRKDGIYARIKAISSKGLILYETSTGAIGPFFQGTSKNAKRMVRISNDEIFSRIDQWKITGVSVEFSKFRNVNE